MPDIIGSVFFKSGTYGWSESFYLSRDTNAAALARMVRYVMDRQQVLNRDSYITYVRCSKILTRNDSEVQYFTQAQGRGTFGNAAEGEQPFDGLLLRLSSTDVTRRMFIMRGVPAGQITSEGVYNPTQAFRRRMLDTLIPDLQGALGFNEEPDRLMIRRRVGGDRYGITALTVVTGNNRAVNVTAEGDLWPPEREAFIRVSQVDSMARVNRIWKVRNVITNQIQTYPRKQRVIGTYEGGGLVSILSTGLVPITQALVERGVRRDTGRPSDSPRGRRSRGNQ